MTFSIITGTNNVDNNSKNISTDDKDSYDNSLSENNNSIKTSLWIQNDNLKA